EVSGPERQRSTGGAGEHDRIRPGLGNRETRDGPRICPGPGFDVPLAREGPLPGAPQQDLGEPGLRVDVCPVPEEGGAPREERRRDQPGPGSPNGRFHALLRRENPRRSAAPPTTSRSRPGVAVRGSSPKTCSSLQP